MSGSMILWKHCQDHFSLMLLCAKNQKYELEQIFLHWFIFSKIVPEWI